MLMGRKARGTGSALPGVACPAAGERGSDPVRESRDTGRAAGPQRNPIGNREEMTSRSLLHGRDVRAVVLVGGRDFGRCPLAACLPTALWPVTDEPVLAHLLSHLAEAGLGRVAVCCAKEDAAAVAAVCRDARLEAVPVVEELTAGTAGCLRDAVASDPGDLILVLSGSMLAPPALGDLVEAHRAGGADLTLVFNPGPGGGTALGGPAEIYLCRPEVLRHIPPGGYSDIKEGLIPSILRAGGTVRPVVLDRAGREFPPARGVSPGAGGSLSGWRGADLPAPAAVRRGARSRGPEVCSSDGPPLRTGVAGRSGPVGGGCGGHRSGRDRTQRGCRRRAWWSAALCGPTPTWGLGVRFASPSWMVARCCRTGARLSRRRSLPAGWAERPSAVCASLRRSAWAPGGVCAILLGSSGGAAARRGAALRDADWPTCSGARIVLAAFLWSYWPTFRDLLEEWHRSDEYSSGLLVPFLAAYVIWLRREGLRVRPRPTGTAGSGWAAFCSPRRCGPWGWTSIPLRRDSRSSCPWRPSCCWCWAGATWRSWPRFCCSCA